MKVITLLRRLLGTTTKTIRCVYYGPADLKKTVKVKGRVVIVPFPTPSTDVSDFVGIYEVTEE